MLFFLGRISMSLNSEYSLPATDSPADVEAAERKLLFEVSLLKSLYI